MAEDELDFITWNLHVKFDRTIASIGVELEMVIFGLPVIQDSITFIRHVLDSDSKISSFGTFDVKKDGSIQEGYYGKAVEIATPIMLSKANGWETIIPHLCSTLTTALASNSAKAEFNSSTALQVHIGVGEGQFYTLENLKRISKAIILFEKQMDKLHPECRNPNDLYIHNCNRSLELRGFTTPAEKIGAIEVLGNYRDLINLINANVLGGEGSSKYYKYGFVPLQSFGTIEFRQAHGTLNPDVILKWIETVIKFVTKAVETSDKQYEQWAEDMTKGESIPDKVYKKFGAVPEQNVEGYWLNQTPAPKIKRWFS